VGDLTKNFSRKEFACNCGCGFNTVDFELLQALQNYSDRLQNANINKKVSITVNSGCRCQARNKSEGGTKNSQHLLGRAADIVVKIDGVQIPPTEVADFFNNVYSNFSTGVYKTFTHVDTRTGKPWRG
jgi:uncharacterized protein YcbK (DUF882 family)